MIRPCKCTVRGKQKKIPSCFACIAFALFYRNKTSRNEEISWLFDIYLKMLTVWEHFLEEFHEMGPREAAIGTLKAEPNGNV